MVKLALFFSCNQSIDILINAMLTINSGVTLNIRENSAVNKAMKVAGKLINNGIIKILNP